MDERLKWYQVGHIPHPVPLTHIPILNVCLGDTISQPTARDLIFLSRELASWASTQHLLNPSRSKADAQVVRLRLFLLIDVVTKCVWMAVPMRPCSHNGTFEWLYHCGYYSHSGTFERPNHCGYHSHSGAFEWPYHCDHIATAVRLNDLPLWLW